jgi:ubiquitin-protein ligase
MSSRRLKRITNEIKELHDSQNILEQSGIYFNYNEENMNIIYALLIGPENTPYEKGFYFFKFEYPESYPMEPPKTKYCTQGILKYAVSNNFFAVRFNPNLYTCGKVCLSMLNTWQGPGWVPTNTLSNVLVAIQALVLNEEPLQNEPGYENAHKKEFEKYNNVLQYANIKISVLEMISKIPKDFEFFKTIIEDYFIKNIDYYRNFVLSKNDLLKNALIESPAYGMKVKIDYSSILYEIEQIYDNIMTHREINSVINSVEKACVNESKSETETEK